jgi:hypothetical protein
LVSINSDCGLTDRKWQYGAEESVQRMKDVDDSISIELYNIARAGSNLYASLQGREFIFKLVYHVFPFRFLGRVHPVNFNTT